MNIDTKEYKEYVKKKRKKAHGELIILPKCPKCKHNSFDKRFMACLKCGYKEKHPYDDWLK